MTIKSRVEVAKKQAETSRVFYARNAHCKTYVCTSTTDNETHYQSTLECLKDKETLEDISFQVITCECHKTTVHGAEECKGNSQTICRHTMATLIKANQKVNKTVTFFDSFSKALTYSNFGGTLYKVQSTQGQKQYGWITIKAKSEKKLIDTPTAYYVDPGYTERVFLMRGPVEEGIE